jgi:hypothetical protein
VHRRGQSLIQEVDILVFVLAKQGGGLRQLGVQDELVGAQLAPLPGPNTTSAMHWVGSGSRVGVGCWVGVEVGEHTHPCDPLHIIGLGPGRECSKLIGCHSGGSESQLFNNYQKYRELPHITATYPRRGEEIGMTPCGKAAWLNGWVSC